MKGIKTFPLIFVTGLLVACSTPVEIDSGMTQESVESIESGDVSSDLYYWTITFDSNGGTDVATINVLNGQKATQPADPSKEGYLFQGWFVDKLYLITAFDWDTAITADWTLYAKWQEESSSSSEDSSSSESSVSSESSESSSESSSSSSENPIKTFYFKDAGWWAKDNNEGVAGSSIYLWKGATNNKWPGTIGTLVSGSSINSSGGNIWKFTVDTSVWENMIFVRTKSTGGADYGAKTVDLTISSAPGNLYDISGATEVWGNPGVSGTWSMYNE